MKIAFLGAGNMGGAILTAAMESGVVNAENVLVYDKYRECAEKYREAYGVTLCHSADQAAKAADVLFVAVKPNIVPSLMEEIKEAATEPGKYLVSIAAGVQVSTFTELLGSSIQLVRTIPNMPAMVKEGVTGLYFHNFAPVEADEKAKTFILNLFSSFGKNIVVDKEKMIDEMVAVTSSSPAYVCLMIEAMADAAVLAGFTRKDAYIMAEQAVLGSAKLMLEREIHPGVLKDQICSPGGTTIEAVASLEATGFRSCLMEAMEACREKTFALGRKDK